MKLSKRFLILRKVLENVPNLKRRSTLVLISFSFQVNVLCQSNNSMTNFNNSVTIENLNNLQCLMRILYWISFVDLASQVHDVLMRAIPFSFLQIIHTHINSKWDEKATNSSNSKVSNILTHSSHDSTMNTKSNFKLLTIVHLTIKTNRFRSQSLPSNSKIFWCWRSWYFDFLSHG